MFVSTLILTSTLLAPACGQSPSAITIAPTIPTAATEFVNEDKFTSAILNSTNFYRIEHNASDVSWNKTLQDFASHYLDSTCDFEHSGGPYGENLAIGCSNATSCVEAWGNEAAKFDFRDPDFSEESGHFTQLVWKNTTDVGCSARICGDSGWYLACEYWPRGNVIGQFSEEVGADVNEGPVRSPGKFVLVAAAAVSYITL